MPKYFQQALHKFRSTATAQDVKIPVSHGTGAQGQPAEDQQIEAAFRHLAMFISHHVEEFYDLTRSDVRNIFDFEPTGETGVKAALRRYIAWNVFQYIVGMTEDQSMTTHKYNRGIPTGYRDHLHQTLEPYTRIDKKSKWRGHLDEILKLGTELARLVSSQHESRWYTGNFGTVSTLSTSIIYVRVFPSLLKNGQEIRGEEMLHGTGKLKPKLARSSRLRTWGAKQTSRLVSKAER